MSLKPNEFVHKQPKVIDVSHWEGAPGQDGRPHWDEIMAFDDAPEGVICKATDYYANRPYLDKTYIPHITELYPLGVPFGAYHYFNPEFSASDQAYWFVKIIGSNPGYYPPALDLEKRDYRDWRGRWVRMPKGNAMAARVHQFLDIVEYETGRIPMIYTSASYVFEYMRTWTLQNALSDCNRYPLWLAQYPNNPDLVTRPKLPIGWSSCYLWQYSEAGVLKGFPYDGVDLNVIVDEQEPPVPNSETNIKMVVTAAARPHLNVRELPLVGAETVGRLYFGDLVVVKEFDTDIAGNTWARIGIDSWCAAVYNGTVYLTALK